MRILKSYFMRNRKIVALLCAVLCVVAAILFQKLGNQYYKRYFTYIQEELEKSYSSGDYQAYRYCIHDGKLSEVTIKVSEEASERDDFLTNCYQIKNTIEKIAKKNPKYFTLCYNKSFWVIFQIGNEDMMIYFTNDDYGTTDYYEEDTVFYEQLCCVVMNTIEERIWNMKVLENIRYIYIHERFANGDFLSEISTLSKLPQLEHIDISGLTDEEARKLAPEFEKRGIWFES